MAGQFSGLIYDKEAYDDDLRQSVAPANYRLDPNFAVHYNPCFSNNGPRNGHEAATVDAGNQIDLDSILRGVGRVNSNANRQQMPEPITSQFATTPLANCPSQLESQNSRHTHPARDIRGMTVPDMRFDYLHHDPQCHIFENFGVNTRLQAKDDYRAEWVTPMDQQSTMPKRQPPRKPKQCTVNFNCF